MNNNSTVLSSPQEWQGDRQARQSETHFPTAALCDTSEVNYGEEPQPLGFDYKFMIPIREEPVSKEDLKARKQKYKENVKEPPLLLFCLFFSLLHPFVSVLKPESTMQYL